jgi:hypothetical protein
MLYCEVYRLRESFPLVLIYTPIIMGGCREVKLSNEADAMKWKILQSSIHLGGLSKNTSNMLIQRGLDQRLEQEQPRGYVDSLLQWSCELGLHLCNHAQISPPHYMVRIWQILVTFDPSTPVVCSILHIL